MAHIEERQIIGVGDSLCVTLPRTWLNYYNAKLGTKVKLITKGNRLLLTLPNDSEE